MRLSLRARLLVAVAAITLVTFALADVALYGAIRSYLDGRVDTQLATASRAVARTTVAPVGSPAGTGARPAPAAGGDVTSPGQRNEGSGPYAVPGGLGASQFCATGRQSAPGMFIEVLTAGGEVVTGPAGREYCPAFQPGNGEYLPDIATKGARGRAVLDGKPTRYLTVPALEAGGPYFRARVTELPGGRSLVLAMPVSDLGSTLGQLVWVEVLVTVGAVVGATVLGSWLVRVGLRPLREVERTAEALAGGNLAHRAPNPGRRTEVGRLAQAFNAMISRIERLVTDLRSSEARLRRFVGDASHELRTPIAAISAYAQLFEEGAASRPEDLGRAMRGIERESARMSRLVEDLLTLARLDEHRPMAKEPLELVGLAAEARETASMVDRHYPVSLVASGPVEILGDAGALRRVVDNLLANVRAHTPLGTSTVVTVTSTAGEATLEVADDGPGVPDEQAGLVFERFFRADPSRSRETGGAGLGLAIVASIVGAHGGQVEVAARPAGGAVFRVRLPLLGATSVDGKPRRVAPTAEDNLTG